jgi:hypothetical protein
MTVTRGVMPSTRFGKWAGGLLGLFVALLAVFQGLVVAGQRGGETFFSNPALTIPMLGAVASAIAGGVLGVFAMKHRDRSLVVYLAIVAGLFVLVFTIAEFAFPH